MKLFGESRCILWSESDNKRSLRDEYGEIGCTARSIPTKIRGDSKPITPAASEWAKLTAVLAIRAHAERADPIR